MDLLYSQNILRIISMSITDTSHWSSLWCLGHGWTTCLLFDGLFLLEASFGLRVLSFPLSVRPSVTKFVRVIIHQPFKLGSPHLDQRYKTTWLRSLLFYGTIDLDLQCQFEPQSQNLPHLELVHAITHHQLKLQFFKFGTKMHLNNVQIPTNFGPVWNWSSIQFLISNPDQIELFMYIIVIL